jgi:alkanesulfonate monooxygenase SsuD/methylene tetrahydromethanopterin reductase-like flavin-dependent oxidoreductase (luciferase family)
VGVVEERPDLVGWLLESVQRADDGGFEVCFVGESSFADLVVFDLLPNPFVGVGFR